MRGLQAQVRVPEVIDSNYRPDTTTSNFKFQFSPTVSATIPITLANLRDTVSPIMIPLITRMTTTIEANHGSIQAAHHAAPQTAL